MGLDCDLTRVDGRWSGARLWRRYHSSFEDGMSTRHGIHSGTYRLAITVFYEDDTVVDERVVTLRQGEDLTVVVDPPASAKRK